MEQMELREDHRLEPRDQAQAVEAVRDKIARRIANIGHAPGFESEVAARVGGQGCRGVGKGAAGGVDSAADDQQRTARSPSVP